MATLAVVTYECWTRGRRTVRGKIDAENSFAARRAFADKYKLDVTDVACRRLDLPHPEIREGRRRPF
jgi:hypothetical protein